MQAQILFLTGLSKEKLLENLILGGRRISTVVVPKSEKYRSQYEKVVLLAAYHNIKVISAPPQGLTDAIAGVEFDVLLSCGYPFRIPESVYSKAKYAINFHPTLLPKHRGRYLHYILINKDEKTGVTAHLIDEGYDTGAIVRQLEFKVSPFDTVKSLTRKAREKEIGLVNDVIRMTESEEVTSAPQDESKASAYFTKRTLSDSEIDPSKPLNELFYEIRACDPVEYPAFFQINGEKVYIHLFRKDKSADEADMI